MPGSTEPLRLPKGGSLSSITLVSKLPWACACSWALKLASMKDSRFFSIHFVVSDMNILAVHIHCGTLQCRACLCISTPALGSILQHDCGFAHFVHGAPGRALQRLRF